MRKLEISQNPPKILAISQFFFFEMWAFFSESFQKVPLTMLLGTFF
jgi:hypothetical protein